MSADKERLFYLLSDLEYVEFDLERVRDLLSIYDGRMTRDIKLLHDGLRAELFENSYRKSKTLMDILYDMLSNSIQAINKTTQAGYELAKIAKASTQAE